MMTEWLTNYLLHSTLLIAAAAVTRGVPFLRAPFAQDVVWKTALIAGLLTASVQTLTPLGSLVSLAAPAPVAESSPVPHGPSSVANGAATGIQRQPSATAQASPSPGLPGDEPGPRSSLPKLATIGWVAWLGGTLLLLGGTLRDLAAERRLLAERRRCGATERQRLCGTLRWPASVPLSISPDIDTPLATRGGEVVVPAGFAQLPAARRESVLAHELGHLHRRDPLWRLLARLVNAVCFMQPLNRLAEHRLVETAELLSDQHAVMLTGGPGARRALANSLAGFARVASRRLPRTACAMVTSAHLVRRVEQLLSDTPLRLPTGTQLSVALAATVLAGAVGLPGISTGGNWNIESDDQRSVSIRNDDGVVDIHLSQRGAHQRIELDAGGRIGFSEDYLGIDALREGGHFDLEVTEDGTTNRIELENPGSGLQGRFWVAGTEKPYDEEARQWLAGQLPEIFRATGIESEGRVQWLLNDGGIEQVLAEIDRIDSDLVARTYAEALARQATLDADQLSVLLELLGRKIGSDLELRLALAAVMEHQTFSTEGWRMLIAATEQIGSDLEQRLALAQAAALMPPEKLLIETYLQAAGHIGSDLEARLAIEAIGDHLPEVDDALLAEVLASTRGIGSDLEQRLALEALLPAIHGAGAYRAYVEAASGIGSDLEGRLALAGLIERQPGPAAVRLAVLSGADHIGSDLELSILLATALDHYADDGQVRDAVITACQSIGSELERNRVLSRLAR